MNKIELVAEERQKILENPDLILLDRELLLALLENSDFPDEENLVDIRNIFLKKLGEKVEKLKTTNSQIIQYAYENQLGIKKIHKCCLEAIETKDVDNLLKFLCFKAAEILRVDVIKIVVSNNTFSDTNIENCILKSDEEIITYTQKIGITKEKTVRLKNVVGDKKRHDEGIITREESTKSEAIISLLVNNNFKGLVFLESADESTFSVDQSTDYLDFFAQVITKHMESLLFK
ncbi:DUF484 family protein [Paracoccaceae bacterium]|nr:DUF484 family protein [Paracoccaceae bacterium]